MRILVYPHSMEVGGSQINALELAAAIKGKGHEVFVFAGEGPLVQTAIDFELEYLPAPRPHVRPSPTVMKALCRSVRRHKIDIIHAYEWPPTVEAIYGPLIRLQTPTMCTIMSMAVAPFIPTMLPMTVGTEHIAEREFRRRGKVTVLEPPVDTEANRPSDRMGARRQLGVEDDSLLVVVVSRLAQQLKREGILAAIDAIELIQSATPAQLLIVGDGPCRDEVQLAADRVNRAIGQHVVRLTGAIGDPRPAYAAADVIIGMGGSALRGMAFGKPLVVQGEAGFFQLLTPETLPVFERQGWYGIADGTNGASKLSRILIELAAHPRTRDQLGEFSRRVVVERFSLDHAANTLEQLYETTTTQYHSKWRTIPGLIKPLFQVGIYEGRRRLHRLVRPVPTDDFNTITRLTKSPNQRPTNDGTYSRQ